jgi:phosphatidylglycerophosphatase A
MAAIGPAGAQRARPGLAFLLSHPAHCIALGFGSGLLRPGPGTWGTLFGWGLFAAVDGLLRPGLAVLCLLGAAGLAAGTWAAHRAGRALGEHDAGEIVIDEVVAFWWLLALIPQAHRTVPVQAAAFLLFRLFDILKPFPISAIDRRWRDAFGVMLDDLMAAVFAMVPLALWIALR